ncbi:MAG: NB-ARC domain-containing protein, partial [Bacteroidota bacterium]
MIQLRKSYQKILLLFWCGLLGLSIGAKKTYALTKPFFRITCPFGKKNYATAYDGKMYTRYISSIKNFAHRPFGRVCYTPYALCTTKQIFTGTYRGGIESFFMQKRALQQNHTPIEEYPLAKKLNFSKAPAKEAFFIGRTKEIATLAPYFDKPEELVILPPITGFGGLGKTQLVHKLIEEHAAKYDHIVWINAATEKDIESSYAQIAKDWGILPAHSEAPTQVITFAQNRLSQKRVLYVFDNAPNLTTIQSYLKNGHVLITSRNNATIDWQSSHYDAPIS